MSVNVSPVLGCALKCLTQGHSHERTQRIQCGSNPGPLEYESNTTTEPGGTLYGLSETSHTLWQNGKQRFILYLISCILTLYQTKNIWTIPN